jgi:hypothetical protein
MRNASGRLYADSCLKCGTVDTGDTPVAPKTFLFWTMD